MRDATLILIWEQFLGVRYSSRDWLERRLRRAAATQLGLAAPSVAGRTPFLADEAPTTDDETSGADGGDHKEADGNTGHGVDRQAVVLAVPAATPSSLDKLGGALVNAGFGYARNFAGGYVIRIIITSVP